MSDDAAPTNTPAEPCVPTPLAFVAVCQFCGRPVSYVDHPGEGPWNEETLWSYVALETHQRECPAYRVPPPPATPASVPTFSAQRRGAR